MDEGGIPETTEDRVDVVRTLMKITRDKGIEDSRVYIDPLVMAASTNTNNGIIVLEAIRLIKEEYPDVHVSVGLSNISFGLPVRTLVNQAFLTLAIQAGLDTAILDPLDKDLRGAILSAELVLGMDRHCQRYSRAYKKGLIGSAAG
jgi:5-methyltetrahydrofolate--homocysteine methyltransferase